MIDTARFFQHLDCGIDRLLWSREAPLRPQQNIFITRNGAPYVAFKHVFIWAPVVMGKRPELLVSPVGSLPPAIRAS